MVKVESNRRQLLTTFHRLLNTADGIELVGELEKNWHEGNPIVPGDQLGTGFNIGLSEAYKQVKAWQDGEGLHDR